MNPVNKSDIFFENNNGMSRYINSSFHKYFEIMSLSVFIELMNDIPYELISFLNNPCFFRVERTRNLCMNELLISFYDASNSYVCFRDIIQIDFLEEVTNFLNDNSDSYRIVRRSSSKSIVVENLSNFYENFEKFKETILTLKYLCFGNNEQSVSSLEFKESDMISIADTLPNMFKISISDWISYRKQYYYLGDLVKVCIDKGNKSDNSDYISGSDFILSNIDDFLYCVIEIDPEKYPEEYMYFKLKYS